MSTPKQYLRWVLSIIAGFMFLVIVTGIVLLQDVPGSSGDAVQIIFTLDAPEAQSVSLVGDFNKWDINANPLYKDGTIWKTEIYLKKGTYIYNFVIDREKWITDPAQVVTVEGDFGGKNSIVEVY